jgi:hypothetical protein
VRKKTNTPAAAQPLRSKGEESRADDATLSRLLGVGSSVAFGSGRRVVSGSGSKAPSPTTVLPSLTGDE